MKTRKKIAAWAVFWVVFGLLFISACGNPAGSSTQPATSTPTPTEPVIVDPPTPTTVPSPCEGLSGELEIQVLVGPSEAVGLSPHAVGRVPFAVTTEQEPYLIDGGGGISFADTLIEEWGTYEVTMDMTGAISGECKADDQAGGLDIVLELAGSQLIVVTSEGFTGEYPWEGTLPFDFTFPLEEGASAEGEGYVIVLHLN